MIIFTKDATPFRSDNEILMYNNLDSIPNLKETTYILHSDKFTSDDVIQWSPVINNKLVVVTDKEPKLNKKAKDLCVVDDNLKGKSNDDAFVLVRALLNWGNRDRVKELYKDQPTQLLLWFLKENVDDIDVWRRISKVLYTLPEEYMKASLIYGIKPSRARVKWPKKKGKSKERPEIFRSTDQHWEVILENYISVANKVRDSGDVPKGMKRTKQKALSWL